MNDKRFIDGKPFSQPYNEEIFNKSMKKAFHDFDENGVILDGSKGFIDPKIPDEKHELWASKKRINSYLNNIVDLEVKQLCNESDAIEILKRCIDSIEEKIREKVMDKYKFLNISIPDDGFKDELDKR